MKKTIIQDLHKLFMIDYASGDFSITMLLMMKLMEHHGIKFQDGEMGALMFFERLNSSYYDAEHRFEILCDEFLDFGAAIAADHAVMLAQIESVTDNDNYIEAPSENELHEAFTHLQKNAA